jgi:hypothetical protein
MSKKDKKSIPFTLSQEPPRVWLFAPKETLPSHPPYRAKTSKLKKLCSFYLEGKITLDELHILSTGFDNWKHPSVFPPSWTSTAVSRLSAGG